jgi:hypothetical protein
MSFFSVIYVVISSLAHDIVEPEIQRGRQQLGQLAHRSLGMASSDVIFDGPLIMPF